jgi:hypothetical protein
MSLENSNPPLSQLRPVPHLERSECAVCGRLLTVHQKVSGGVCGSPSCLHRKASSEAQDRDRKTEALRQQLETIRDRQAPTLGLTDPENVEPVVIPANLRQLSQLPRKRSQQFRAYLEGSITQALARTADPDHPSAHPDRQSNDLSADRETLLGHGCTTCRGHCCSQGGTHAFLNPEEMAVHIQISGLQASELLSSYLSHAVGETYEDSCIFHGPEGCRLPREKRSRICNGYLCHGLSRLLTRLPQGPAAVFFGAVDGDRFVRASVADESGRRIEAPCEDA